MGRPAPSQQARAAVATRTIGGLGVEVAQLYDKDSAADHRGEIVILAVVEGSPAAEAGLHAGQIICSVDGVLTKGRQFKSIVVEGLRGAVGTYVNLRIRSGPSRRPRKVRILRDAIRLTRQKEVRECKDRR